jgi:hypothetical protein
VRRAIGAALLALACVTSAAQAGTRRTSLVSVTDPAGDANGVVYVDPDHEVDTPPQPATSDNHYDILRLTAVADSTGVRLTVRLAGGVADAGETVWVGLTPVGSDCTLLVLVSDTVFGGHSYTGLASWCGQGEIVSSAWLPDRRDARADEPAAFVPYSAFPDTVPAHGDVRLRAVTMRDAGGATVHVARVTMDGVRAVPRLRLRGSG